MSKVKHGYTPTSDPCGKTPPPVAVARRALPLLLAAALVGCSTPATAPPPAPTASPSQSPTAAAPDRVPGSVPPGTLPPAVEHGPRNRRQVALTFDADLSTGMLAKLRSGRVTSYANMAVVDELERHQAPATIFFTGMWMERYPRETDRIVANPLFELATHSYAHRGFRPGCYRLGYVQPRDMLSDVVRTIELLRRHSPRVTRYFRFPGGCKDATALRALAPAGITDVEFDVISGDAFGTSAETIVRNILTGARNGSIVVLHVNGGDAAPHTAKALPKVIKGLRAKGFELVRLSTLLGQD